MSTEPRSPEPKPQPSLAGTRAAGVLFLLLGVGLGYWLLYRPFREALQTGNLEVSMRAILLAPGLLYTGVALQVSDLRNGTIKETGPHGKTRYTRKGKIFLGGLCLVLALAVAAWYGVLHMFGFQQID